MCGVCGIAAPLRREEIENTLHRMANSLAHRGPDDSGIIAWDGGGIGHRRLAIVGGEDGKQPFTSGPVAVTANCEIFNHQQLRGELDKVGLGVASRCDAAIVAPAYRAWGMDLASTLEGQFAFGLYDGEAKRWLLARDRLGEKPLYYYFARDHLLFSSEVTPLIRACRFLDLPMTISPHAVSDFLSLNYLPREKTLIEEIRQVPPGAALRFQKGEISLLQYWHPSSHTTRLHTRSPREETEALTEQLRNALSSRLMSERPVGLFLSGGVDSSLLAALLSERGQNCRAFIAKFEDNRFDESAKAQEVASRCRLQTELVPIRLPSSQDDSLLRALVRHGDTPLGDSSSLAVYQLAAQAALQVPVVLTGDGADELFGGYLTHRATMMMRRIPQILRHCLYAARGINNLFPSLAPGKVSFREKMYRFLRAQRLPAGAAHFAWNGGLMAEEKNQILNLPDTDYLSDTFCSLAEGFFSSPHDPDLEEILLADLRTYLPYDILEKTDRMTMAHGLEARPLYTHSPLVEFALSLPPHQRREKRILNAALRHLAPWYRVTPKQGFSIPVHRLFRENLREWMSELIAHCESHLGGILNRDGVERLWQRHLAGQDRGFELWGIMVLLLWSEEVLYTPEVSVVCNR